MEERRTGIGRQDVERGALQASPSIQATVRSNTAGAKRGRSAYRRLSDAGGSFVTSADMRYVPVFSVVSRSRNGTAGPLCCCASRLTLPVFQALDDTLAEPLAKPLTNLDSLFQISELEWFLAQWNHLADDCLALLSLFFGVGHRRAP